MKELWLISEFEKIAALNPDKVIRLLKKTKNYFGKLWLVPTSIGKSAWVRRQNF